MDNGDPPSVQSNSRVLLKCLGSDRGALAARPLPSEGDVIPADVNVLLWSAAAPSDRQLPCGNCRPLAPEAAILEGGEVHVKSLSAVNRWRVTRWEALFQRFVQLPVEVVLTIFKWLPAGQPQSDIPDVAVYRTLGLGRLRERRAWRLIDEAWAVRCRIPVEVGEMVEG